MYNDVATLLYLCHSKQFLKNCPSRTIFTPLNWVNYVGFHWSLEKHLFYQKSSPLLDGN